MLTSIRCMIFGWLLLFSFSNFAQSPQPNNYTATGTLAAAAQAFAKGAPVHQVTLAGTVNWIAGSDNENGTITLVADADGSYQVTLNLGQGTRTETQTSFAQGQQCTWSGTDGVQHVTAIHNCLLPVAWFIPSVALFGAQQPSGFSNSIVEPNINVQNSGIDLRQQLLAPTSIDTKADSLYAHLAAVDIIFDNKTYLPTTLTYSLHPDLNAATDIPVQVVFSNYQTVEGITVPFSIQQFINGVLAENITVSAVTWN